MLSHRLASEADLNALHALMERAIGELQKGFLDERQIAASHAVMGLDTQLVADRTYFIVEADGRLAGCGGWSRRATLYGGDHSTALREPAPLDPAKDAARVRAMYTDPAFARRGVGRLILELCEGAAAAEGFSRVELMATLSGEPLYLACGYRQIERTAAAPVDGVEVPLVRMGKSLTSRPASLPGSRTPPP
ncbi:MAG TPA: GNAT family N-acetyltransferase [Caulobacteraceae bacterium]|jgi:GNAT superfamily N-acetyltransferase